MEPSQDAINLSGLGSVAEALHQESDKLRQLAAEVEAAEQAQAEMQSNYPFFKRAIYAALREKFERELPPLPDKSLEALAVEDGAMPLEDFIQELEQLSEGPNHG